jgi:hypothetical protein
MVYGTNHDVSLKIALKSHKGPKDVLEYVPVKTDVDEIKAALETEGRTTKAAGDAFGDEEPEDDGDEHNGGASATGPATSDATKSGVPPRPPLTERAPAVSGMSVPDKKFWVAFAKRTVAAHVKLITEPDTSSDVRDALYKTAVAKVKGIDKGDCVMILFDVKQSGECITSPHIRVPPLRDEQIGKLLMGVLEARRGATPDPDAETMVDGDVLCMFDGGRHGTQRVQSMLCLLGCRSPCHAGVT